MPTKMTRITFQICFMQNSKMFCWQNYYTVNLAPVEGWNINKNTTMNGTPGLAIIGHFANPYFVKLQDILFKGGKSYSVE